MLPNRLAKKGNLEAFSNLSNFLDCLEIMNLYLKHILNKYNVKQWPQFECKVKTHVFDSKNDVHQINDGSSRSLGKLFNNGNGKG